MEVRIEIVEIPVEICRKDVQLPAYVSKGAAGMDVKAAEDAFIRPGETATIPTGLKMAIPEGFEIQVRNRSGISRNTPIRVSNSPGTLDSDYRDEICVLLTNHSQKAIQLDGVTEETCREITNKVYTLASKGNSHGDYKVTKGDRIAQLVVAAVPRGKLKLVDSVKNIGEDRGGGFGHTGISK